MKKFIIKQNKYLKQDIIGFYNCDYIGYRQPNNPDFINHLKNMSNQLDELDLVDDFIEVITRFTHDCHEILSITRNMIVCVVPRSKNEKSYNQSQRLFKKAISCAVNNMHIENGVDTIKRVRNSKTTYNWRLSNNTGKMPYPGITKDTCEINESAIRNKTVLLVDDIYTKGVNVAEDCIQTLLDLGAKDVILYVIAKTKE